MKQINLLPWREQLYELQRRNFLWIFTISTSVVLLAAIFYCITLQMNIARQENVNAYLNQHILRLKKNVDQIKKLQANEEKILGIMQSINNLQINRNQPCYLFSELSTIIPQDIFLTSMKYNNQQAEIIGTATTNLIISSLMNNLSAASWFAKVKLAEIKNNQFIITFEFKH